MANRLIVASLSCGAALLGAACSERSEESVRDVAPEQRNPMLLQAIRDAGYLCDQVIDATSPDDHAAVWRVLCNDMLVYVASTDAAGSIHVEPIPYGDPAPWLPVNRNPDKRPDSVQPDP